MDKIDIILKMIDDNKENAYAWYLLGLEYIENNNASEALQAFSNSLKYCDDSLKGKVFEALSGISQKKVVKDENLSDAVPEVITESGFNSDPFIYDDKNEEAVDFDASHMESENLNDSEKVPLRVITGGRTTGKVEVSEETNKVTFKDVGGLENVKDAVRMKIIKPFVNPGLFDKFKKKVGGGILLFGPPGCGKTYIAKATAGECDARFIPVHITDILDPYLGVSSQNIKDIFSNARAKKPCILFFDEIDTIGYSRSKLSSEHMRPVIDQFLTEIEGIDSSTEKLLIIGATNMPWDVDSAFKRPGRFDKTVFVPPPDEVARELIFKLKLKDRPFESIDFRVLANKTELYSGADIENVVEVATEKVINEIMKTNQERAIGMKDLLIAIEETKPSTIEWLRTIKNYVKYSNQAGLYDDVEKFLNKNKKVLF